MKLKLLKLVRFFHLISKRDYNEKRQIEIVKKSPLFDKKWYLSQNPDIKAKKMGAAKHYVKYGWKEGRNPSLEFDTNVYLQEFPELREKNWCPLFHYMLEHEYLMPKTNYIEEIINIFDKITNNYKGKSKDYKLIAKSKYFNKRWYLKQYPDVKKSGMDPAKHYLKHGWTKGYNPSLKFDGNEYIKKYYDIKNANVCPLLHYIKSGIKEGREIFKSDTKKVYLLEWDKKEKITKIYFSSNVSIKSIKVKKDKYFPKNLSLEEEENYNKYCQKEGYKLYLFEVYSSNTNEIELNSDTNIEICIQNFNNFRGKFLIINNKKIKEVGKIRYAIYNLLSLEVKILFKILWLKNIFLKNKYLLYYETANNAKDNAWQLFLFSLSQSPYSYFVTNEKIYKSISDKYIKSHLLIKNSFRHIDKLMNAKAVISSYFFFNLNNTWLNNTIFPFLKCKLFFIPHGISCDKDSYYLNYRNLGQPDTLYCCSEYEKKYFSSRCGIKNIKVLGYPRMDKWYNQKLNENKIIIFFTWRKNTSDIFIQRVKELIATLIKHLPNLEISYIFHPNTTANDINKTTNEIKKISKKINIILPEDSAGFNKEFAEAKILITDYSSVAYDFMYTENRCAIFYKPIAELDAIYNLLPIWEKITLCEQAETIHKVISYIKEPSHITINKKRKNFFKYLDGKNTQRVFKDICNDLYLDGSKYSIIAKSKYFDYNWYIKKYESDIEVKQDPIKHYLEKGWKKGYNPSKNFDTQKYLYRNIDVMLAKVNPLLHYETSGKKEKRIIFGTKNICKVYKSKNNFPKAKENILLISHILNYTGAPILLLSLIKIFHIMGYGVILLSPTDGDLRKEALEVGADVYIDPNAYVDENAYIKYKKLNVVFCIFNTSVNFLAYKFFKQHIPSILWIHENLTEELQFKELQDVIRDSSDIYVPSTLTKSYIENISKNIKILPYPVKDMFCNSDISEKNNKIIKFGLVAAIHHRKGHDIAIDAIKMLPDEIRRKAEFVFIGDATDINFSTKIYQKSQNIQEIKFRDAIKDRESYYKIYNEIDILLCPSREDPYPLVVIDALMFECPVIISSHVGQKDIINDGINGYVFKSENSKQLSKIIEDIIKNKNRLIVMSKEARNTYLKWFDYNSCSKMILKIKEAKCKK